MYQPEPCYTGEQVHRYIDMDMPETTGRSKGQFLRCDSLPFYTGHLTGYNLLVWYTGTGLLEAD